jgi:8-oxo-dGTP diphosphatase
VESAVRCERNTCGVIDAATGWYAVPATVKGVVISPARHVLLARNRRGAWELPGGWPTADDASAADVLRRELLEETGLQVEPGPLVHAELVEVDGGQVMVVAYLCSASAVEIIESDEHTELCWASHDMMPPLELEAYEIAVGHAFALLRTDG